METIQTKRKVAVNPLSVMDCSALHLNLQSFSYQSTQTAATVRGTHKAELL